MMQHQDMIKALASGHRDFERFSSGITADLDLSNDSQQTLAQELLKFLREDEFKAQQLTILESGVTKTVGVDVAFFVAVAFLLRTHIKLSKKESGEWDFLIEHKPSDSEVLTSLLKRINELIQN